jgi:hypothetical protein
MDRIQTGRLRRFSFGLIALLLALFLLLQACTPLTPDGPDELPETPGDQQPEPMQPTDEQEPSPAVQEPETMEPPAGEPTPEVRELRPIRRTPEMVPMPGEAGDPVTGETPQNLLDTILADLKERTGSSREEITVIRDQAVTWSDGSLGCPQPGVFYTQALVPGYWVVLQIGEKEYDYRASDRGYFVLCESGSLPFDQPVDR